MENKNKSLKDLFKEKEEEFSLPEGELFVIFVTDMIRRGKPKKYITDALKDILSDRCDLFVEWLLSLGDKLYNPLGCQQVTFSLVYRSKYGENCYVVGSCGQLGNWTIRDDLKMTYMNDALWAIKLPLPVLKSDEEYKYVLIDECDKSSKACVWEPLTGNRVLRKEEKAVIDIWGQQQLSLEFLYGLPPESQKQCLGEFLYLQVEKVDQPNAGKITGMLLDLPISDAFDLLHNPANLATMIREAQTFIAHEISLLVQPPPPLQTTAHTDPPLPQHPIEDVQSLPPEEQRQIIGELLYFRVMQVDDTNAGKITGMLLEMPIPDLVHLLHNATALSAMVREAQDVLTLADNTQKKR